MRLFYNIKSASLLLAACLLAASCAKDNPKEGTIRAKSCNYFRAVASADSVAADCETIVLDVDANVSWTLTADNALVPSVKTGEGTSCILIEVPANDSFTPRTFSYSVSTVEELDVDDPAIFTKYGDTLSFNLFQAGMVQKFYVDADSVKVTSASTAATVTLTTNIEYGIVCQTSGLSCSVEKDGQEHYLNFSFPTNTAEEPVFYRAVINPASESFQPIQIVIRQSGFRKLTVDCTNASLFRYDNGGTEAAFPTTDHGKNFVENVDFWLNGKEEYVFHGSVKNWSNTLNAAQNSKVKLPAIEGFVLTELEVTYSNATAVRNYAVYDEAASLGSCSRGRNSSGTTKITVASSSDAERYFVCTNGEMCAKFKLTYSSID